MRVDVPEQEDQLEEHQTYRPNTRRSAEPRQDLLSQNGLDQEQQEGRQKDSKGGGEHRVRALTGSGHDR